MISLIKNLFILLFFSIILLPLNKTYEENGILRLESYYYARKLLKDNNKRHKIWNEYKLKYIKNYINKRDEDIHMKAFFDKISLIIRHNSATINGNESYYLNINHYTDYTPTDYQRMIGRSFNVSTKLYKTKLNYYVMQKSIPKGIDWRHYGVITDVKNQGHCGNGWIFAAIGAVEAVWKLKTGNLINFSSKVVADCTEGDSCAGGWVSKAFDYSKQYGMIKETDYPNTFVKDGDCKHEGKTFVGKISRWIHLQTNDEEYLKIYVGTIGPVVVGIDASLNTFQTYSQGIYDDPGCGQTLNHVVLLIGYGSDDHNIDYWIAKNSYGNTWGEQGYFKIRRGINRCGIALAAAAPIV